jgi:hypothetical protein
MGCYNNRIKLLCNRMATEHTAFDFWPVSMGPGVDPVEFYKKPVGIL